MPRMKNIKIYTRMSQCQVCRGLIGGGKKKKRFGNDTLKSGRRGGGGYRYFWNENRFIFVDYGSPRQHGRNK